MNIFVLLVVLCNPEGKELYCKSNLLGDYLTMGDCRKEEVKLGLKDACIKRNAYIFGGKK